MCCDLRSTHDFMMHDAALVVAGRYLILDIRDIRYLVSVHNVECGMWCY